MAVAIITSEEALLISRVAIWAVPFLILFCGWLIKRGMTSVDECAERIAHLDKSVAVIGAKLEELRVQVDRQHRENLHQIGRHP